MQQKSKMVSFRLPADDYFRLREACFAAGIENVSELARAAMHRIIDDAGGNHFAIDTQVQELRHKLEILTQELDRLASRVAKTDSARA